MSDLTSNKRFKSGLQESESIHYDELKEQAGLPIRFSDHNFADYIWGGYELYKLKKLAIKDHHPVAAESWEISGHEKYPSTVVLPSGKTLTLPQLLEEEELARKILGNAVVDRFANVFPLIIKFFDVQKHMSVQVHPNDEVAASFGEKDPGKGEIFIVLDVYPGAEGALYLGLKDGISKERFEQALNAKENLLNFMHKIEVKPGEIYELPSGAIHCWTGGTMAVEITEASDLTYRLYDFGRGRPMHHEKGLASIDFGNQNGRELEKQAKIRWQPTGLAGFEELHTKSEMAVQRICLTADNSSPIELMKKPGMFEAFLGLKGHAQIKGLKGEWSESLAQGYSLLLPAALNSFRIDNPNKEACEILRISMDLR